MLASPSGKSGEMIKCLFLISLLIHYAVAKGGPGELVSGKKWQTLSGKEPLIVARGGLSGLFPESSYFSNLMYKNLTLPGTALQCSLQLTKDGVGVCLSKVVIETLTSIALVHPNGKGTYKVNGKEVSGWFALDFTLDQLTDVGLVQGINSRPPQFDNTEPISTVEAALASDPEHFWLHVPYDAFYNEHKLSPAAFVQKQLKVKPISFLSSPEIGFLKAIGGKVDKLKTKLIFDFLDANETEPTTKQTYGALLRNLGMIKSLAAGILVPKEFIYPVTSKNYLEAPTTLVQDAHKAGLEVYAKGFANDNPIPYNYSMDPTAEIQQFVDNSHDFSVDGVHTDFSATAAEAIACFSHNKDGKRYKGSPLIITRNGASGIYPGSTDLAYQRAVDDGADIIDCSVQMSSDGVAFCLDAIDLNTGTNALTQFMTKSENVPEIQKEDGVFSYQLTWEEIQSLKPQMASPYEKEGEPRNPAAKEVGKLVTLNEFLEFAKKKNTTGISINIKNAAYLASKVGLDIVGTVSSALKNTTLDNQSDRTVMIKSDDTSVLSKFADVKTYKRVFSIMEPISTTPKQSIEDIKKFADGVVVTKESVIQFNKDFFSTGKTNVVNELKAANLSVYIYFLKNELTSLLFDFLADPITQIATYAQAQGFKVDGFVTDFPATASKYMRSPCANLDPKADVPYPILPVEPGGLLALLPPETISPSPAPAPALTEVVNPPLPPVAPKNETNSESDSKSGDDKPRATPAAPAAQKSIALANAANWSVSLVAIMVLSLLSTMGN